MNIYRFVKTLICIYCFAFSISSHAATIDVDVLNIDSIAASMTISPITQSDSFVFSPPYVWDMGEYNGLLFSAGNATFGFFVESTGVYGAPASSGTVDTSLGTIDLILSDLHVTFTGGTSGDFNLWNSLTSTIDVNSYNLVTGAFLYGWSDSNMVSVFGLPATANYSIEFAGTASSVPVPASVWLFGSVLGLLGWVKRSSA